MTEVRFDLASQPLQHFSPVGGQYRANVDTMLAENVGDSFCLNRISDLSITSLAFLHEKTDLFVYRTYPAYFSTSAMTLDHSRL